MKKRAIVSIILFFTFIMMPVSGVLVHVGHGTHTGHNWLHLHVLFGIIFMVAGVMHLIYNWRVFVKYLKPDRN